MALGAAYLLQRTLRRAKPRQGPLTPETLPQGAYDAVIVGAGEFLAPLALLAGCHAAVNGRVDQFAESMMRLRLGSGKG